MLNRLTTPIAALSLAALVVASAGTGAVAQRLIGSKDVADNSLTGRDIKNNTLTGSDVKDGSLTTADVAGLSAGTGAAGPKGDTGATGAQGPKGDRGPAGTSGADEVVQWNVTYTSDGSTMGNTVVATSAEQFAKSTELKPVRFEINGDFSGCRYPGVYLKHGFETLASAEGDDIYYVTATERVVSQSGPLTMSAYCEDVDGKYLAIPSFTATVVLQVTHLDTAVTRQIN